MKKIEKSSLIFYYSPHDSPVASVSPNEVFAIETHERFDHDDGLKNILGGQAHLINAVTGPVEVIGARPSQVLKVDIVEILPTRGSGFILTVPGKGVFYHEQRERKKVPLKDGHALFSDTIKIPLNPHIGRIATAPASGEYPTGTPGPFGGNMDNSQLGIGSSVYLPVFVPGALLSLGDVHAVMGDGESNLSGVEIAALVTVKCSLIDDLEITYPLVETKEEIMTTADGRTLEEASQIALDAMLSLLKERAELSHGDAAMLISAAADLRVCQIVNPRVGVRVAIAKRIVGDLLSFR